MKERSLATSIGTRDHGHTLLKVRCWLLVLPLAVRLANGAAGAEAWSFGGDTQLPPVAFAIREIERALSASTYAGTNLMVQFSLYVAGLKEQRYRIRRNVNQWLVTGGDAAGAMYGGLDLAEAIRLGTLDELQAGEHRQHIPRRGIKLNIPLDLRTPSCSVDNHESENASRN